MDCKGKFEVAPSLSEDAKELRQPFFPNLAAQHPHYEGFLEIRVTGVRAVLNILRCSGGGRFQSWTEGLTI